MPSTPEEEIRDRLGRCGSITFAEFMEVALYHRSGGYYVLREPVASHGDYYTSPAAHPAFGALIALELRRMWTVMGSPARFDAIEMGAAGGILARDVVQYAARLPGPFRRALRYVALDLTPSGFPTNGDPVSLRRVVTRGVPFRGIVGCLLSNELVDAFPVHRFQIQGGAVREVFVTLVDGRFASVLGQPSSPLLERRLQASGVALPEGYKGEVNLRIGPWMREVAGALERGFVLTIDYGSEAADLYRPERPTGTLQTYYRHTAAASPFQRIGRQDMTAHVDFSSIITEGESVGLRPVFLCTQSELLRSLGLDGWLRRLRTRVLPQRQREANAMAMRDLARTDGLGGFKVLVQEKRSGIARVDELLPPLATQGGSPRQAEETPIPLLSGGHLPLMEGRYPHSAWELQEP